MGVYYQDTRMFQIPLKRAKMQQGLCNPESTCPSFLPSDSVYISVSSLFLRRPTFSATQLFMWLGEDGCPYILGFQITLSDNGD